MAAMLAVVVSAPAMGQADVTFTAPADQGAPTGAVPDSQMGTLAGDPELGRMSEELEIAEGQLAGAQASGDQGGVQTWGPVVDERTEVVRERIISVTHKPVRARDVIPVLKGLGLWGPTSEWAKADVSEAYATGRMFGIHKGAIAADEQGQRPATRQELAAVSNRVAREGVRNLGTHSQWDQQQHQALWQAIQDNRMWRWIIPACIAALLLFLLFSRFIRRRRRDCDEDDDSSRECIPWAQRGVVNTGGSSYGCDGSWPQGGVTTH